MKRDEKAGDKENLGMPTLRFVFARAYMKRFIRLEVNIRRSTTIFFVTIIGWFRRGDGGGDGEAFVQRPKMTDSA